MNIDDELRGLFLALFLFSLIAPLLFFSSGCGVPTASEINTLPGMWAVIFLLLGVIGIGLTIYAMLLAIRFFDEA